MTVLRPDDFADILYQMDRDTFRSAMIAMTKDNHRPPRNLQELTETLNEQEKMERIGENHTVRRDETRVKKHCAADLWNTAERCPWAVFVQKRLGW